MSGKKTIVLAGRTISTEKAAFVMGIVNATPDSFWEKSRGGIDSALRLIDEGADILDIGGESSRPGSAYVSLEEEMRRVVPLVKEIRKHSGIPLSVDTRKYGVMKAAFEEGADILNDISALEDDSRLAPFAAEVKIPVILMHKKGNPDIMQKNTDYIDVFAEVDSYLASRAAYAQSYGIQKDRIILDPGIGFGKNLSANCTLIKKCGSLCGGKYTVLMALSRKTCIGEITGRAVEDRYAGTLSADIMAVLSGASIIRVHDVSGAVDSMKIVQALLP